MSQPLHTRLRSALPDPIRAKLAASKYAVRERFGEPRCLPDYIGIGTIKGGSTSLWHYVSQHPQVLPAREKQVRYFDYYSYLGPAWYRSMLPSVAEKEALSAKLGLPVITGEVSPSYLSHPTAAPRAAALVPNVRLVAVLRNPIERAYSHWQHSLRKGGETVTDFDEALALEDERIDGERERIFANPVYFPRAFGDFSYRLRGRYAEHLTQWLAVFPREQLLVVQSEQLFANPEQVLTEQVFPFLGIAPVVDSIEFKAQNVGRYKTPISNETRASLRDYFAPHNAQLEALLAMTFDWD